MFRLIPRIWHISATERLVSFLSASAAFCLLASIISLGRPPVRPRARAAASPAFVRSLMMSRSNSASEEKMWKMSLPSLVLVPILSWGLLKSYNPTSAAAFSRKSDPSLIYLRRIGRLLWPVCPWITRSETPAIAAAVASPARKLCPA